MINMNNCKKTTIYRDIYIYIQYVCIYIYIYTLCVHANVYMLFIVGPCT